MSLLEDETMLEGKVSVGILRGKGPGKEKKGFGGYGYLAAIIIDRNRPYDPKHYNGYTLKDHCDKEDLDFFWKDVVQPGCLASWLHVRGLFAATVRENYDRYTSKCRELGIFPIDLAWLKWITGEAPD